MAFQYQDQRTHNLSKLIIDHYGFSFFRGKTVLDLGCGLGQIGNALSRLGATVTAVDARDKNLKAVQTHFPHIKTLKIDLEKDFPFALFEFDIVLSLGVLCHLKEYEKHLQNICNVAEHIIIETEVLDSHDPNGTVALYEEKAIDDLSFGGQGSIVAIAKIQQKLSEFGANFRIMKETKLNYGSFRYDWMECGVGRKNGNRRIWIANRNKFLAQQERNRRAAMEIHNSIAPPPAPPAVQQPVSAEEVGAATWNGNLVGPAPASPPPPASIVGNYNMNDKKFVIVIPSYKNERWCEKNIQSAITQNYQNYRVIFTDDCSSDSTFDKVAAIVNASNEPSRVKLIKNERRVGALENLYNMIHSCDDDEIILTLDGDDYFPHQDVLNRLNHYYAQDVWITYGQYKNSTDGGKGVAQPYPPQIIQHGNYRSHIWSASHLRTFYAWLFKKIRKEDLMKDGQFFQMTWDFAMMFPMLEMAGDHQKYIDEALYVYNLENPINDHKVNRQLQAGLDRYIRHMPRYQRCEKPIKKTKIGLLIIATGKYHTFIQGLISSADKYFLTNDKYTVTYHVFSDGDYSIQSARSVDRIHIDHKPFPFASMDRFKHFTNNREKLIGEDYLYYVDVDCLFVDGVGEEIIGNLVGVRHCGFWKKQGPYETRSNSTSYIDPSKYKYYYGGGFSGGRRDCYLELARACSEAIEKDVSNNIIPVWHDESQLNKYFSDHTPDIILNPSYHYPQNNIHRYKHSWLPDSFNPKILLLDKNHSHIRS